MLGVLLESRAARQRRPGGAALSAAVHLGIAAGLVTGTAHLKSAPPEHARAVVLRFAPPVVRTPVVRTDHATSRSHAAVSQLAIRHIAVPTIVPTTLPSVDFTAIPDASDSLLLGGASASASTLGVAGLLDGAPSAESGSPWRGNEVLMHILSSTAPRYPEPLRLAGIDGQVLVRFTVDTTGRVDMRSVEILSSTHDLFSRAVRDALSRFRFRPAEVGGRRIPALAEMPFEFRIRK